MQPDKEDSSFVKHVGCDKCGSSDGNALYSDGHTHCFACGTTVRAPDDVGGKQSSDRGDTSWAIRGEIEELPARALTEETARKFAYQVGKDRTGRPVQIANYRDPDTGALVAQKLRRKDKTFTILGDGKDMPLFGQHLWKAGGRRVVVTEGEIDALSVAQASGLTWPVVSLPNGAKSARDALKRSLDWLETFETVVLCFDNDEPGQTAARECADLFTPGRCAIAQLPRKDASDMLQAGEVKELSNALWQARVYRPDGIVSLDEIEVRVLAAPETGRPYPWKGLTDATFGRRLGEVVGLGAGTGMGKTDFFSQMIAHDVMDLKIPVGVLYLEQGVGETGRRIAGKIAGRAFHVPDGSWTQDELRKTWADLKSTNRLFLYDNFGAMDWPTIKSKMRYMTQSLGVQHLYLDHLTALAAVEQNEREALEKLMAELAGLAKNQNVLIHYVSHLATPSEGKSHEEGGRVQAKHFKGSRAIQFWSDFMFGLERDQQTPGSQTVLRVLKDRFTGRGTGKLIGLDYDTTTGRLTEGPLRSDETAEKFGFRDDGKNQDF